MNAGEWILSILLFIVSLGILIVIHELGHLSMAKLFNVYCQEFSIGFGPALLHKRKKGKETYFSIRAIPLGGYVSMYGEEMELEPGVVIPEERSLEGIKKWKKAIIVSAGIIMNTILALVLFSISNLCFPVVVATTQSHVEENSIAYNAGVREDDVMLFITSPKAETNTYSFEYQVDKKLYMGYFTVVDTNVVIDGVNYVLTYYPEGDKNETSFTDGCHLYLGVSKNDIPNDSDFLKTYSTWYENNQPIEGCPDYLPNFKIDPLQPYSSSTSYFTNIAFRDSLESIKTVSLNIQTELKEGTSNEYRWKPIGLSFKLQDLWLDFGTRVQNIFVDFGNASIAVFKGLGNLFTGGIQNLSGIVGIMKTSASVLSTYTFARYLYFWGLISVNLAIFNLLPFPGLDGFTLVVTAIEGATKKKIPNKFKNIMSMIGLIILFGLMIVILVFDIMRWTGLM